MEASASVGGARTKALIAIHKETNEMISGDILDENWDNYIIKFDTIEDTQKELAQKSGIPLPTYKRFEQTGEIQLSLFLNILYVLGLNDWIKTLMTPYFDPFDDKKINKKRVRK